MPRHHGNSTAMTPSIPLFQLGEAHPPTTGATGQGLVMYAADAVLYRAQGAGRNRDVVACGKQAFRCAQND
jgi:hypothetical protein